MAFRDDITNLIVRQAEEEFDFAGHHVANGGHLDWWDGEIGASWGLDAAVDQFRVNLTWQTSNARLG